MPRYIFDAAGASDPDLNGTELPDHHAARREAIKYAALLVSKDPDLALESFRVDVRDASYTRLYTVVITVFDASRSGELLPQ